MHDMFKSVGNKAYLMIKNLRFVNILYAKEFHRIYFSSHNLTTLRMCVFSQICRPLCYPSFGYQHHF